MWLKDIWLILWSSNPTPWQIYSDKMIIQKGTCTPIFITALLPIAKKWKQPKFP